MYRISPHSVKMLIRSIVPADMQISAAAVDRLREMMESHLLDLVELYGEEMVRIAVQNARAEGRHRLMSTHFDLGLRGARNILRPTLGQTQINWDALAKIVAEAETEILTEEAITNMRRVGLMRARVALVLKTQQAVERAKARGARRVTIDDVA